jgi:hypothetical protein
VFVLLWCLLSTLDCISDVLFRRGAYSEREPCSSVSIVSIYGLDDRAIEVRSPAEAKDISLASVSTPALGSTLLPVQWVLGVLSPRVKRDRGVTLTTHSYLVPKPRMSRSYTPLYPSAFMACSGTFGFSIW